MLLRNLQNLEPHPQLHRPLIPRHAQHPKTRLILDPLVHSPIRHQRIPRFVLVLLRGVGIDVGDLAARTAGGDVEVEGGGVEEWSGGW